MSLRKWGSIALLVGGTASCGVGTVGFVVNVSRMDRYLDGDTLEEDFNFGQTSVSSVAFGLLAYVGIQMMSSSFVRREDDLFEDQSIDNSKVYDLVEGRDYHELWNCPVREDPLGYLSDSQNN